MKKKLVMFLMVFLLVLSMFAIAEANEEKEDNCSGFWGGLVVDEK